MTAGYGFFAERYRWTPDVVDALPHWYSTRLPEYAAIIDEIRAERQKQ